MSERSPYRIDARVKDDVLYYLHGREVSKHDFLDAIWTGSKFGPNGNGANGNGANGNKNGAE